MGEARKRGTFEQRKAAAIVRDYPKNLERLREEKQRAESYDRMVMDMAADVYLDSEVMRAFMPEQFGDGKPEAVSGVVESDNVGCLNSPDTIAQSANLP